MDTNILRKDRPEVLPEEAPHACIAGVVYIGHMQYEDEHGEEVETVEAVPCRHCSDSR